MHTDKTHYLMICKKDLSVTVFKTEGNKIKMKRQTRMFKPTATFLRSFQNKNKHKRKYN